MKGTSIEEIDAHAYIWYPTELVLFPHCANVFHRSLISRRGKLHRLCFRRVQGLHTYYYTLLFPIAWPLPIFNAFLGVAKTGTRNYCYALFFIVSFFLSFLPSILRRIFLCVYFYLLTYLIWMPYCKLKRLSTLLSVNCVFFCNRVYCIHNSGIYFGILIKQFFSVSFTSCLLLMKWFYGLSIRDSIIAHYFSKFPTTLFR